MADAIDQLIDDVLVDAYGPDEQLWAFRQAFEDTATFPFAGAIAGAGIDVTDIDYDGDDHRGLLAVCRRDGQRHTVSLLDVVPTPSLTAATSQLIDAYRRWAGAEPLPRSSSPPVRPKRTDEANRRKQPATPSLDALHDHERGEVLIALLGAHPELLTDAEHLAVEIVTGVLSEAVADNVVMALANIPLDDLTARAGSNHGGYTEPHVAAWQLLESALDPFLADVRRLATLGHTGAATTTAAGILAGLHQLPEPEVGSVLAYAGPDTVEHLAENVLELADDLGLDVSFDDQP
jgi:hypothetical protein